MKNKDEIIWNLVSIENNISKLSVMLENQALQKGEMITRLLHEIESMAADCRKRMVVMEFKAYAHHHVDGRTIVSQKEVRELLEAFA
ncbi:MAG: hypothetical protein DSZ05_03060 [Sulfurospirillum sp.]|nr:MAG: hypothetical protein DSZ05_03060 [Sulfurospirillum sp.]